MPRGHDEEMQRRDRYGYFAVAFLCGFVYVYVRYKNYERAESPIAKRPYYASIKCGGYNAKDENTSSDKTEETAPDVARFARIHHGLLAVQFDYLNIYTTAIHFCSPRDSHSFAHYRRLNGKIS